ncbi:Cathepsin_B [Hexamita inflata]|uniref:Cathepsin B n=1 Tax=Hexamita inflata TaxID=28002 RepID=A0AA86QPT9_9EUKA|nr:Cathepsin B [Hexamita inflata]
MFCVLLSQQSSFLQDSLEVLKNIPDLTWTPEIPKFLLNKSQEHIDKYFTPKLQSKQMPLQVHRNIPSNITEVDEEFDWTVENPKCVNYIESMEHCVATELFASINMLSDLRCIYNYDEERVQYSHQYHLNCFSQGIGCERNNKYSFSFEHLEAPYGTVPASCVSYTSGLTGYVGKCPSKCDDGSTLPKRTTIDRGEVVTWGDGITWDEAGENFVKRAVKKGPIQLCFTAYTDVMFFNAGVYQHQYGDYLGDFRGEVMGWGTDNGIKFWKLKMSFGEEWGEKGYLRIAQSDIMAKFWEFIM